ncbi:hypothetical protein FSST1_012652 [Fusarium sambucinum]
MDDLNCNELNATECLLRVTASILEQLKEDSSEFNWDPASFVVTLVIGIIAAAFAFFAIIQGFLAAGPGRHKCSKYAIGTWASISKRRFDWSELRYRSVAHTPIISIQDLVLKMELQTTDSSSLLEWEWRENGSGCWNQDRLFPKLKHVAKEDSDYFPATWLRLLTHTGLHHPELWRTNPQGTDYLPSDLAAAPAYSTVADLISIASITAGNIRFNSFGPGTAKDASMRGEYMDLNFRSHPLLGVYAAIDQAIPSGNDILEHHDMRKYRRPSAQKLLVKLAYGQGFLLSVQHLQADTGFDPASMDLRLWSAERMKKFFTSLINNVYAYRCDCRTSVYAQEQDDRDHRELMFEWCRAKRVQIDCSLTASDPLLLGEGDISILAAAIPLTKINLFPKKLARVGDKFIFLVLLSRYCMKAGVSTSEVMPTTNADSAMESDSLPSFQVSPELWGYLCGYIAGLGGPADVHTCHSIFGVPSSYGKNIIRKELDRIDSWIKENQQEDVMVCRIMALAFTTAVCKEMYHGDQQRRRWPIECDITPGERYNIDETISYDDEVTPNSLEAVTDLVTRQVQKLRRYEQNRGPGTLSVNEYFTKSCKELHKSSGWTPNEKPFRFLEYMEHITKLWEKDKNGFKYPTKQVQHYLDDILVYRATLMYMVISQATDNSHILTNPEYYKLIPVI